MIMKKKKRNTKILNGKTTKSITQTFLLAKPAKMTLNITLGLLRKKMKVGKKQMSTRPYILLKANTLINKMRIGILIKTYTVDL